MDPRRTKVMWAFASFEGASARRRFLELASALGDDYEHLTLAMDGGAAPIDELPDGVMVEVLDGPRPSAGKVFSLRAMWRFRKALVEHKPDLLMTADYGAIDWLVVNRGPGAAPHIHFEFDKSGADSADLDDPKRSWGRRRAFPGKNRAFVADTRMIAQLYRDLWGAPEHAVSYIPVGVDLSKFSPDMSLRGAQGPVRLGAVGPMTEAARLEAVLRLGAELRRRGRNVSVALIGDGPERDTLQAAADEMTMSEHVSFIPAADELAPNLTELDVLVSTADAGSDPTVLLGAMAMRLPIVSTAAGDALNLVDESNKLFIRPAGDESALIAAAELMVADQGLRADIGAANRERVEMHFALDVMVRRYDNLFREMARRGAPLMLPAPDTTPQTANGAAALNGASTAAAQDASNEAGAGDGVDGPDRPPSRA